MKKIVVLSLIVLLTMTMVFAQGVQETKKPGQTHQKNIDRYSMQ